MLAYGSTCLHSRCRTLTAEGPRQGESSHNSNKHNRPKLRSSCASQLSSPSSTETMAQLPLAPFLQPAAPPTLIPECVFPDSEQPEKTIDKIGLSTFSWGRHLQKTTVWDRAFPRNSLDPRRSGKFRQTCLASARGSRRWQMLQPEAQSAALAMHATCAKGFHSDTTFLYI